MGAGGDPVLNGAEEPSETRLGRDVVLTHELDEFSTLAVHGNGNAVLSEPASNAVVGPRQVVKGLAVGSRVVLGEKSLDLRHVGRVCNVRSRVQNSPCIRWTHIIGLELSIRLEQVLLDEPVSHVRVLPGLFQGIRGFVVVVLEQFLQLVPLETRSICLVDNLVLYEVGSSLCIRPSVPQSIIRSVKVRLHSREKIISFSLSGGLDKPFLLEPVSDSVVVPGLVNSVSSRVVIVLQDRSQLLARFRGFAVDQTAGDGPVSELRVRPAVVGRVSGAVVVLLSEMEEVVSGLGRAGLEDAVVDEPFALVVRRGRSVCSEIQCCDGQLTR